LEELGSVFGRVYVSIFFGARILVPVVLEARIRRGYETVDLLM